MKIKALLGIEGCNPKAYNKHDLTTNLFNMGLHRVSFTFLFGRIESLLAEADNEAGAALGGRQRMHAQS